MTLRDRPDVIRNPLRPPAFSCRSFVVRPQAVIVRPQAAAVPHHLDTPAAVDAAIAEAEAELAAYRADARAREVAGRDAGPARTMADYLVRRLAVLRERRRDLDPSAGALEPD